MSQRQGDTLLSRFGMPPEQIEPLSFEIIGRLIDAAQYSADELEVVKRVVHTTGDPSILSHLRIHPRAISTAATQMRNGCTIFTDVKMVEAGINRQLVAKLDCRTKCLIETPGVPEEARRAAISRAAAGVRQSAAAFGGAVVAIGNAPTALLALLDLVDAGEAPPAAVVGVPVGFVGAAEAKAELARRDIPFITLEGTRGGSTIAVAIINALLRIAARGLDHASV